MRLRVTDCENTVNTSPSGNDSPIALGAYLIEESTALRAEMRQSIEMELQLLFFTLASAGTVLSLGIGLQDKNTGVLLLLMYPVLSLFLAVRWAHVNGIKHRIANYIREELESHLDGHGYETYLNRVRPRSLNTISTRALFVGTQVVALVLAWYRGQVSIQALMSVFLRGPIC